MHSTHEYRSKISHYSFLMKIEKLSENAYTADCVMRFRCLDIFNLKSVVLGLSWKTDVSFKEKNSKIIKITFIKGIKNLENFKEQNLLNHQK